MNSHKRTFLTLALIGLSFADLSGRSSAAITYDYTNIIDPLGTLGTTVSAINNKGEVIGNYSYDLNGSGTQFFGNFSYSNGVYKTIIGPLYPATMNGINDSSQIVGDYDLPEGGGISSQNGYFINRGLIQTFIPPGGPSPTTLNGVNDSGQIVGFYTTQQTTFPQGSIDNSFVDTNGVLQTISDPGAAYSPGSTGTTTQAYGINDEGDVVGAYYETGQIKQNGQFLLAGQDGFVESNGEYQTIVDPNAQPGQGTTTAYGINDSGVIVGDYTINGLSSPIPTETENGFVYDNGVFQNINDPLATGNTVVTGINNAGDIVGNYYLDGSLQGFIATPVVPEASSAASLGVLLAFGTIGIVYRKRRASKARRTT